MFLSRIQLKNFRNFHDLDVRLGPASVVVGENGVGKSNLLFALRLILDPRVSDSSRMMREEDFWAGLKEPTKNKEIIEVSVEFQDFQGDKSIFAVLQSFCVPGSGGDIARLTFRFRPKSSLPKDRELTIEDYEFVVFGGVDEKNRVDFELRRWMPLEVLPALRDAESDLAAWRNSPLRPLVERLQLSGTTLESVATEIDKATQQLLAENDVQQLTQDIRNRLSQMVGSILKIDPSLGFASTIPERLTRALRMFGDGSNQRPVGELSLGVDNILYLLLLAIELERKETASERAATILAIEEPEAHLHPHLQRLVFRDFLRRESPVLLTTHSPHIASVAPLQSIVLLRNDPGGDGSKGRSTLDAGLLEREIDDLQRYLDATRAEVLFARGVVLVEGAAELFLVPAVAQEMGKPLDEYGITVCSVHGTDFAPYAKLLGPQGLNIPFVVLTDGDWYRTRQGEDLSRGLRRVVAIATAIGHSDAAALDEMFQRRQWDDIVDAGKQIGVFVGNRTLEVDLFDCWHGPELVESLRELGVSTRTTQALQELADRKTELTDDEADALLKTLERIGKGRAAQRLAGSVDAQRFPTYIKDGIQRITEVLSE